VGPKAPDRGVQVGDRVVVIDGMHRRRQGEVVSILPASGEYARVELPEGIRTMPLRFLQLCPRPR
jgi:hypothetical protein